MRVRQRPLCAKELADVFGIDVRHLRRLQNQVREIEPVRRSGSCRISGYTMEEVVRFAAGRFRRRRRFNEAAARRHGYYDLLDALRKKTAAEQARSEPASHAELRLELLLDVLVSGGGSDLAAKMGVTSGEVAGYEKLARDTIGRLFRQAPSLRSTMAGVVQDALIAAATTVGST